MAENVQSFKDGGALWFTDLSAPDSLMVFTVLVSLTFWMTIEVSQFSHIYICLISVNTCCIRCLPSWVKWHSCKIKGMRLCYLWYGLCGKNADIVTDHLINNSSLLFLNLDAVTIHCYSYFFYSQGHYGSYVTSHSLSDMITQSTNKTRSNLINNPFLVGPSRRQNSRPFIHQTIQECLWSYFSIIDPRHC